jgi:hypothetical protein
MAEIIEYEEASFRSLFLNCCYNDQSLSTATGFVVARPDGSFLLITNWHVVTGRRTDTKELMSSKGAIPDRIRIFHNRLGVVGEWVERTEFLYDESGNPRWLEHPQYRSRVDVVGLPLTNLEGVEVLPYSYHYKRPFGVSDHLSIIGFPFGLTGGGALGIWVQGTVATEPAVNFDGLPCFLIDSRTRSGQSGSPVVVFNRSGIDISQVGGLRAYGSSTTDLLGVYSGRINENSDLGRVWKTSVVEAIALSGVAGAEV